MTALNDWIATIFDSFETLAVLNWGLVNLAVPNWRANYVPRLIGPLPREPFAMICGSGIEGNCYGNATYTAVDVEFAGSGGEGCAQ